MSRYHHYQRPIRSRLITGNRAVMLAAAEEAASNPKPLDAVPLLLQALVVPGDATSEGQLIEAVTIPWFEIVALIQKAPDAVYDIDWRKWEEIIAGAYKAQGFEVTLTPRSNDGGRDVIAVHRSLGSICFLDQVKRYKPGHLVSADEVRSMLGVLALNPNASKGIITTTSSFAPGVLADRDIARLMPYRLELKPREVLLPWLSAVAAKARPSMDAP